jgi:hypothetical protein
VLTVVRPQSPCDASYRSTPLTQFRIISISTPDGASPRLLSPPRRRCPAVQAHRDRRDGNGDATLRQPREAADLAKEPKPRQRRSTGCERRTKRHGG